MAKRTNEDTKATATPAGNPAKETIAAIVADKLNNLKERLSLPGIKAADEKNDFWKRGLSMLEEARIRNSLPDTSVEDIVRYWKELVYETTA